MSVYDFIHYNSFDCEKGKGPIIFTNPFAGDWYRYDDDIDYYSAHNEDNLENNIKIIPRGIHPHNSAYINRKTGERIMRPMYRYESLDDLSEEFKMNRIDIVPKIPEIIVEFCNVLRVFKNPLTVYRLKPMLFTWWD